jgi:hypothetical protein
MKVTALLLVLTVTTLPAIEPVVILDGRPVRTRIARNLSSADAKEGENVDFEVLDDVKVGDQVIVARGATAMATVTEAKSKRSMGRGGKLDVNIDYVRTLSGEKIPLRGVKESKGGGHVGAMTGAMVATSIVFFPAAPLFLFIKGKDTTIPKGHEVTVYVNGDVHLEKSLVTTDGPATPQRKTPIAVNAQQVEKDIFTKFTSEPSGAEVTVDGEYAGSTPLEIRLKDGPRSILIKKRGFVQWERKIRLETGDHRTFNAELEPEKQDPSKPRIYGLEQK